MVLVECKYHLCKNKHARKSYFCSGTCLNKFCVLRRRRQLKNLALAYKGGKCESCGYDKSNAALSFHHINPLEKEFGISAKGNTRDFEKIKKELDKCKLLCMNCHNEEHGTLLLKN